MYSPKPPRGTAAFFLSLFTLFLWLAAAKAQCPSADACLENNQTCTVMRIPDSSIVPPIPADSFVLTKLRTSVYSYADGTHRALILYRRESRRLTVLDMPNPAGSVLPSGEYKYNQAIRQVLGGRTPKRLDMVYGHRHLDHIGGAGLVYANLTASFPKMKVLVWGTRETREFLSRFPNTTVPLVRVIVGRRGRTVDLAPSLKLRMSILGGHTKDDLVGHVLPSRDGPGVVHHVDFVTPGFTPFLDIGVVLDLARYLKSLRRLRGMDFETFSAGHGRLSNKSDITITIQYVEAVLRASKEAATEVTPEMITAAGIDRVGDPNAVEFGNTHFAAQATIELQGELCVRKLIQQFGCKLGGVAAFGRSHCKEGFVFGVVDTDVISS